MAMTYVTRTGMVQKINTGFDGASYAAAARARYRTPKERAQSATPTHQALDGTPCRVCGASGWKGCAHQLAAAPIRPEPKVVILKTAAKPKCRAGDKVCNDALVAALAFIERNAISEAKFVRLVNGASGSDHDVMRALRSKTAVNRTIERVMDAINQYEGICHVQR